MAIYLVDMENIPHAWAKLLEACTENDRFVLFYTERISQVPIALMEKVTRSSVTMEYIWCHRGTNGLDFQLVSEMGYRIAKDPAAEYIIVSKDHGFDVVVAYWKERGVCTKRIAPSAMEPGKTVSERNTDEEGGLQETDSPAPQNMRDFLCGKLSNKVRMAEIPGIADILTEAMVQGSDYPANKRLSFRFTYLDRALRGKYGAEKGPKLRDQIKSVCREVFNLDIRTESGSVVEPAEPAEAVAEVLAEPVQTAAEMLSDNVYDRLSALELSASRAKELSEIVSEVLENEEEHQKAVIYRRILSTFGRRDGVQLYRTAKESVEQILLERNA